MRHLTYHDLGDNVVLSPETTAAYLEDPAMAFDVQALAQRNVEETARECIVFADDGATVLFQCRPERKV